MPTRQAEEQRTVPTGVAIRDVRDQLFDAAERVLLRDGPNALTSRAVTTEAGCAKGVLHRHFADFDAFLAEFVLDRAGRVDAQTIALLGAAGTGTVAGNLAGALTALFGSAAVAVVALITSRDELRARLRETMPAGVPVLTEAVGMIAAPTLATADEIKLRPQGDPWKGLKIGAATYTFNLTDTKGFQDISVVNALINSAIDEKSPSRIAKVGTLAVMRSCFRSRNPSKLDEKNSRFFPLKSLGISIGPPR